MSPENGTVNFSSTLYGSNATYLCDFGFYINGSETRVCQYTGNWDGIEPICQSAGTF